MDANNLNRIYALPITEETKKRIMYVPRAYELPKKMRLVLERLLDEFENDVMEE